METHMTNETDETANDQQETECIEIGEATPATCTDCCCDH